MRVGDKPSNICFFQNRFDALHYAHSGSQMPRGSGQSKQGNIARD